jgi:DNA-binding phage protein
LKKPGLVLTTSTRFIARYPKGNPELKSLSALLQAMVMKLTLRPLRKRVA